MQRKTFVMSEPIHQPSGTGDWMFWLSAENAVLELVSNFDCIAHLHYEQVWGRAYVIISPHYDYEEAWLWVYEQLEVETANVPLSDVWGLEE